MKMRLQHAVIVLFVLVAGSCSTESLDDTNILTAQNDKAIEAELLQIVNEHRSSLGYSELEFSSVAYQYANAHNDYMIGKGTINHDNFSSRALKISDKVNASFVAENVAKDYATAAIALQEWLDSSGHRKNIEGDFTHTGISVKKDENDDLYFTQLFYR